MEKIRYKNIHLGFTNASKWQSFHHTECKICTGLQAMVVCLCLWWKYETRLCLLEVQGNIVVLYKNNSFHTPETYRGGVWKCDWLTCDNQLQTTHRKCFSQGFFSHKTNIKYSLGFATVQQIVGKHSNKKFWEDGVVQFPTWTFLPSLSSKKITLLMMRSWSDLCLQN